ncbi:MAG TPA: D-amino acid dehydrogenase [Stellaceae bacterium]|jgi:D-amino-acid dehydrogenase|nr:D-amino acid dehydrogenase [Stellaceae bacterium]
MQIVVLGAGVVGVTTAYQLAKDGHEVTVIDRQPIAANETSFGNAGMIAPGHSYTWASPKAPGILFRSLFQRDQALRLSLRADPQMWAWCLKFLRNCTAERARVNTLRKLKLCQYSQAILKETVAETSIEYDRNTRGILYLYRDQASFEAGVEHMKILQDGGQEFHVLDFAGVIQIDPALKAARGKIHGGLHGPTDESGDCHQFTNALAEACRKRGVTFRYETTVSGFETDGDKVSAVTTDKGAVKGDLFVLSLGSYAPFAARKLGIDLPIYPVKGYAVTIPIKDQDLAPRLPGIDENFLIAYTPMGNRIRMTATAEFSGYDTSHTPADFRSALEVAETLFPGAGDIPRASYWAGLRPMTPEGWPRIGPSRYRNFYLNAGQGHMGWTMSHGSARLVADLIGGRKPAIDASGFAAA